jgi:hypothetical protein
MTCAPVVSVEFSEYITLPLREASPVSPVMYNVSILDEIQIFIFCELLHFISRMLLLLELNLQILNVVNTFFYFSLLIVTYLSFVPKKSGL